MTLELVGEHTIDTSLLTPGGYVLDAGCRDFIFARGLAERGCKVVAIDADPSIEDPKIKNVLFTNVALSDKKGARWFVMHPDPQARFVAGDGPDHVEAPRTMVRAMTIDDVRKHFSIDVFDVVKLDIEGSEYGILKSWQGPIAKQISIEFHEHVQPRSPMLYNAIFAHLGQWYDVVQHTKEARHCTGENFWDSLLTIKGEK